MRAPALLGLDQRSEGVGRAPSLEQHCGMNPVQRGGVGRIKTRVVGQQSALPAAGSRARFGHQIGEERVLPIRSEACPGPVGVNLPGFLAEELLGAIRHRQQADDALLLRDDPICSATIRVRSQRQSG